MYGISTLDPRTGDNDIRVIGYWMAPRIRPSSERPYRGYVCDSLHTGLLPAEFLLHAISGQQDLVDTAVKTAEAGHMQRRLMKALEDLATHCDPPVRNAGGRTIQLTYVVFHSSRWDADFNLISVKWFSCAPDLRFGDKATVPKCLLCCVGSRWCDPAFLLRGGDSTLRSLRDVVASVLALFLGRPSVQLS